MPSYAQIAISSPLDQLFTYRVPQSLEGRVRPGMRVVVPFRSRRVVGFCLALTAQLPKNFSEGKLKEIAAVPDAAPVFSEKMLWLIEWLSDYYLAPIGEVCRAALPARFSQKAEIKMPRPKLAEEIHETFHEPPPLNFTAGQKSALEFLEKTAAEGAARGNADTTANKPLLLHGITGSGKTEVYLHYISSVLRAGRHPQGGAWRQAILLVPEIGLTPQLIGRVHSRLAGQVAIYHSGLSESWRHLYWEKMRTGEISVVVGTRSALFAPFPNLGAIIVDEEHDSSYKQGEGSFHYHARDAAIVRAKLEGAQVVLGSATPSLESFHNAKKGKYHYISLPERPGGATLPEVTLVDLRAEKLAGAAAGSAAQVKAGVSKILSAPLQSALAENLYRGEQSLLLLNRRGFANFLICQDCGFTPECPNCAITLTYHKFPPALACHYCEFKTQVSAACAKCNSPALKPLGCGTQALQEELQKLFPDAKIFRLDRDTAAKREHRHEVLTEMKRGRIDILLGTQIVAKGHDFPNVTLVGILLADQLLNFPDFRAAERTFQLLTQAAGRSGRANKPGRVLIQTFHPEHFALLCAKEHHFENFSAAELKHRAELSYPPFFRLAQIILQSPHAERAEKTARALKNFLCASGGSGGLSAGMPTPQSLSILGPAKAPIEKMKGKYRWQFLVKAGSAATMKNFLQQTRRFRDTQLPPAVQLHIDVDVVDVM